ncbi:MAG: hypothetical protein GF364_02775 [Candidatus Lokiarchaeota archaeon]|nr:hypothetical protein [Candidatus Lokiarchaeota archaeon]
MKKSKIYIAILLISIIFIVFNPIFVNLVNAATWNQITDDADDVFLYNPNMNNPVDCYQDLADYPDSDILLINWAYDEIIGLTLNITFNGEYNLSEINIILYVDMNSSYTDGSQYPEVDVYDQMEAELMIQVDRSFKRFFFNLTTQPTMVPVIQDVHTFEINLGVENNHMIDWIPNLASPAEWNIFGYARIQDWADNMYDYVNWDNLRNKHQSLCPNDRFPWWIIPLILAVVGAGVAVIIIVKKKQDSQNSD